MWANIGDLQRRDAFGARRPEGIPGLVGIVRGGHQLSADRSTAPGCVAAVDAPERAREALEEHAGGVEFATIEIDKIERGSDRVLIVADGSIGRETRALSATNQE